MAAIRNDNTGVLLIVDVQVGVMQAVWDAPRIIANIVTMVEKARKAGVPVMWVQHADEELVYGSPQWQLVPELLIHEGDERIDKNYNSSFEKTSLEDLLRQSGRNHIVLAGAATNWCIRATAYGALERGFDLTLVKDAHSTETMDFGDGVILEAENIIRELNIAMTWLRYPNRKNGTALVDEITFDTPGGVRS